MQWSCTCRGLQRRLPIAGRSRLRALGCHGSTHPMHTEVSATQHQDWPRPFPHWIFAQGGASYTMLGCSFVAGGSTVVPKVLGGPRGDSATASQAFAAAPQAHCLFCASEGYMKPSSRSAHADRSCQHSLPGSRRAPEGLSRSTTTVGCKLGRAFAFSPTLVGVLGAATA